MVASLSMGSATTHSSLVATNCYHTDKICLPRRSIKLPNDCFRRNISSQLFGGKRTPFSSSSPSVIRAVAIESDQVDTPQPQEEDKPRKYHFLVANAKFMLDEEEHFREQLFEKLRLFEERNMKQDFWLVIEPKFLDKFPHITKRLKRPAVALVSTDATWMTFMKLRLDRVLTESFEASGSVGEALACNPVDLEFEKPEKWVAPYPKYESNWWDTFLPPKA